MVHVAIARGWSLDVERGPDWLFVRPRPGRLPARSTPALAEHIWSLLEQNFTYRLVLEMGEIERLDSYLIEQLLWLSDCIQSHDGMMRICGLSSENQKLLEDAHCGGHLPHFRDREEAVMGPARPGQPR